MIRHLLKLVWNRKRANGLIILEIFLAFLVLFVVLTLTASHVDRYNQPLGFDYRDVWTMYLETENDYDWVRSRMPELRRVRQELETMDEIVAVAGAQGVPYDGTHDFHSSDDLGPMIRAQLSPVSVGFNDVFRLELVDGRWFEETDLALGWVAIVIDEDLAREAFGDESPLGKTLPLGYYDGEKRVVGIIRDFRKDGEFDTGGNFLFQLHRPEDESDPFPLTTFAIRVRPETTAAFEERMVERVRAIAPEWTVEIHPMHEVRATELKLRIAPLVALGIVAAFLLLMVGLGLIGVLWQNVTQRTREIGLRRAIGAHRGQVHRQILLELLLITTIGLLLGTFVVVQFPLLQLWGLLTGEVFVKGLVVSVVLMYGLATACGLYPSWMATRIEPAEALHHE